MTVDQLRIHLAEHYVIERELGRGGMATVYLARDLKHDRKVAIKVLRPELVHSLGTNRFLREISIASRLAHPNVLPVHDSGSADGLLFYVMPYVAGETLRDRLRREGPLNVEDAVQIATEVANGLAYAHRENIVHRDIKPENILLEVGHAVIADFGLARAIHAAAVDDLSSAGLAVGTPVYMSPEQSTGRDAVDGRSDIYSLGCVLYEMLTGEPPFTGPSAQAIAAKHLQLPPPPLRTLRPHVPDALVTAVGRALEKIPADRFQNADEFASALSASKRPGPGGWFPAVRGAAALVLLATALAALFVYRKSRVHDGQELPGRVGASAAAADPTHVAVLYFDAERSDTSLRWIASGLTEDLIDQLGQVEALSVISANGVRPYRDRPVPPDSIARVLAVGTLVTGSVDGSLDHPRVTVRLIEPSGRQVESKLIQPTGDDVLALRSELAQEVARFLRERLGREVRLRELRSGGGARGWVQVRRAEELREDAHALYVAGDTAAAGRTFDAADSLLASIEREDPGWVEPLVNRGWIAADRIGLADARTEAALSKWAPLGIRHAERALARLPGYPAALELRGFLRLLQWQYSPKAEPRLVQAAERDLRAATVPENPSRARAMSTLAYLLWREGSFAEANLVAREAYQADVFLTDAPMVLYRLYVTSLLLRRRAEASDWCSQGHQRFPDQWLFTLCRLTLLSTPASAAPDPAQAWRFVVEMQRVTPPSEWAGLAPRWEMLVATVLARAGQRDSARKILRAAHQAGAGDPEMNFYEAETHVTLGEYQLALDLLDRYTRYAPSQRAFIQGWPTFDPLHQYARFKALQPPPQ